MRHLHTILILGAVLTTDLSAQSGISTPSAYNTIKEAELKADLFLLAGDSLRGREAGTLDELQASMWIGEQFRKTGLVPMGDYSGSTCGARVPLEKMAAVLNGT